MNESRAHNIDIPTWFNMYIIYIVNYIKIMSMWSSFFDWGGMNTEVLYSLGFQFNA